MKRAIWLQETRAMKFEQTQSEWEAGRLTQEEAAQILGICERSFRRYLVKYDEGGLDALVDKRLTQASRRKAPLEERIQLVDMYKHSFSSYNVRHFHQIYAERGGINGQVRSYSWIKSVLQGQQLV